MAGSPWEVFRAFLQLGLTSFGGPIAHLGYFRRELVARRRWVSEETYAQLIALTQLLPGPASSQLGFSLGLLRAGWAGALAAFVAFTTPSAVILIAWALLVPRATGGPIAAAFHGLAIVALVVVAHGVLGMARRLARGWARGGIAALATAAMLLVHGPWAQVMVIVLGGWAGWAICRDAAPADTFDLHARVRPALGMALLAVFSLLLALSLVPIGHGSPTAPAVGQAFYRAGALVFGGGHVVLPLLEASVVDSGWVDDDAFLTGYGAAQAIPGPLFSFSAFLGMRIDGAAGGTAGALLALVALFLPGFLLVGGMLPHWHRLAAHPSAARVVAGINAGVVGLLAAALYDPIWTSAVRHPVDLGIALAGFALLAAARMPVIAVVAWCVAARWAATALLATPV